MTHEERKINAEKAFKYLCNYCSSQPYDLKVRLDSNNPLLIETNFKTIYSFMFENLHGLQWVTIFNNDLFLQF